MPDLFSNQRALHLLSNEAYLRIDKLNRPRSTFRALRIETPASLIGQPIMEAGRLVEFLAVRIPAFLLTVIVRIKSSRQLQDAHPQTFLHQNIDRARGGLLPGGIRVEVDDDHVGVTA